MMSTLISKCVYVHLRTKITPLIWDVFLPLLDFFFFYSVGYISVLRAWIMNGYRESIIALEEKKGTVAYHEKICGDVESCFCVEIFVVYDGYSINLDQRIKNFRRENLFPGDRCGRNVALASFYKYNPRGKLTVNTVSKDRIVRCLRHPRWFWRDLILWTIICRILDKNSLDIITRRPIV